MGDAKFRWGTLTLDGETRLPSSPYNLSSDYNDAQFSILATARSLFHLSVLETTTVHQFLTAYSLPSKSIRFFTPNLTLIVCAYFRLKRDNIFLPIKLSK